MKFLLSRRALFLLSTPAFADTLTVFPAAGANDPVDGFTKRGVAGESFSTIRNGAGTSASATSTTDTMEMQLASGGNFKNFARMIFLFDTSSIDDGSSIDSATFSVKVANKANQLGGNNELYVVSVSPATDDNVVTGDYAVANYGTTLFGSKTYASISTSAYNDFTLNASGEGSISDIGNSKFGVIMRDDFDNSFSGSGSENNSNFYNILFADTAGTTSDPKLVVNFTIPVSTTGNFFQLF